MRWRRAPRLAGGALAWMLWAASAAAQPPQLGLEPDPTGSWERQMAQLDAASFRGELETSRTILLEAVALAAAFDEVDLRVDRTLQAIDRLVQLHVDRQQHDAAIAWLASVESALRRRAPAHHPLILHALERRARLLLARGDPKAAEAALREFVAGSEASSLSDPREALGGRVRLAQAIALQGRLAEARALAQQAVTEGGGRPDDQERLEARLLLARLQLASGELRETESLLQETLQLAGAKGSAQFGVLLEGWLLLGQARGLDGDLVGAGEALAAAERAGASLPRPQAAPVYSMIFREQGALARDQGDVVRAAALHQRALDLASQGSPDSGPLLARALLELALTDGVSGRPERAREHVARARPIVDDAQMTAMERIELQAMLGEVEARVGEHEPALRHAQLATRGAERSYGKDAPATAFFRSLHAFALLEAGKTRDAAREAERAAGALEDRYGSDHLLTARAQSILARARSERGESEQALALFDRSLAVLEAGYGARSPAVADLLEARAQALRRAGRAEEALADAQRLAALRPDHPSGSAAAEQAVELPEYNFRVGPASPAWHRLDPARVNPQARAAFYRSDPEIVFAVMPETLAGPVDRSMDVIVETVRSSLARQSDAIEVVSVRERTIDGITGPEMTLRIANRGSSFRSILWTGFHGHWGYQLSAYGRDDAVSETDLSRHYEEMIASFQLLEHEEPAAPGVSFDSERFGYSVDLRDSGWRSWEDHAADQPNAEFAALHDAGGVLLVLPVSLLGSDPGERRTLAALAALVHLEWPASPRRLTLGALGGIEADFTRSTPSGTYRGRARLLKGPDVAYAIVALANEELGEQGTPLLQAVEAVSFSPAGPKRLDAEKLSPAERRRHANAFNQLGLASHEAGSRGEALRFLEIAHRLAPEDLVIVQNLGFVQIEAGRYADTLKMLEGDSVRFRDNVELLAYRALARSQSGDRAGALRDFEAAFELGLEDEDYLATFAGLLWEAGERDRAYALLDDAIGAHGSVVLRTTRALLHRQAGDYDAAVEDLTRIESQGGADASVLMELIYAYHESGRHAEAIAACDRYAETFGRSADLLVQKARSQAALGLYREAMSSLDQALELEPGSALATEFKSLLAATLGEGDLSVLREPLEAVPFPAQLAEAAELDAQQLAERGAGYLYRIEAVRFAPGSERRRTSYLRGTVSNAQGAETLSTLRFEFDPLWESIWVNDLVVRDASGAVVARKEDAELYVVDDTSESEIVSSSKMLHLAIPGLRAGARFDVVVTRRNLQPPERFDLLDHHFSTGVPVAVSALYLSGDLEHLAEWSSPGVSRKRLADGLAWIVRHPPPAQWEPMQERTLSYLPRLLLGDDRTSWEELGREYAQELASFLEPNEQLRAKLPPSLTASAERRERAARAARYVQENLTYKGLLFGVRARIPNPPTEILGNRFGDCKDHSVLLWQLLSLAGLEPRLALVSTSQTVEPSVPSLAQFDHMIVYCEQCGESGFLDTTDKDLDPSSIVPRGLAGSYALLLDPRKPHLVRIPAYSPKHHTVQIDRRVAISQGGGVTVVENARLEGIWGASFRRALRSIERSQWKETIQLEIFDGQRGSVLKRVDARNVDDPEAPLELGLEYEMRGVFSDAGSRLIGRIPAVLESFYLQATPLDARTSPFEIAFPLRLESTARLELPAGFASGRPAPASKSEPGARYLEFEGVVESKPDAVIVRFGATRRPGLYPASEYPGYYREAQGAVDFFDGAVEFVRE